MTNYVPRSDPQFDEWSDNFIGYVGPKVVQFGFTEADFLPLETMAPTWKNSLNSLVAAKAKAVAATTKKDETRAEFEAMIRAFVKRVQASPTVTDEDRAAMRITVPGAGGGGGGVAPATKPVGTANGGMPMRHTIHFVDEGSMGNTKAKPPGTIGCEIWVKIGSEPVGDEGLVYKALATRTPHVVFHDNADIGKTAYYRLRWVSKTAGPGPWSETFSGTITG